MTDGTRRLQPVRPGREKRDGGELARFFVSSSIPESGPDSVINSRVFNQALRYMERRAGAANLLKTGIGFLFTYAGLFYHYKVVQA